MESAAENVLCLVYDAFVEFILTTLQNPGTLMQFCELEYLYIERVSACA